jgi:hypothetical protein
MRVILPDSPYTTMEIEAEHAVHVDDVVLRQATRSAWYIQVKWTGKPAEPLTADELTSAENSLLRKFHKSWKVLSKDGQKSTLQLITNRVLNPKDPLLPKLDGRNDLLQVLGRSSSEPGLDAMITRWRQHLHCDESELRQMLNSLVLWTGMSVTSEMDRAQALMRANGLRWDNDALETGINAVSRWVREGRRVIEPEDIYNVLQEHDLRARPPATALVINAIDRHPKPEKSAVVLDWVDLYDGTGPGDRRQPRDPAAWTRMSGELDQAVKQLRARGEHHVRVTGVMRQATLFAAGTRLAHVTGVNVSYELRDGTVWSSLDSRRRIPEPRMCSKSIDRGDDLAVAIGIADDPTKEVAKFICSAGLPIRKLLTFLPDLGPSSKAIEDGRQAVTYAEDLRTAVRQYLGNNPADRIHLFLAGPNGLALLLGHLWNALPRTVVYEHLGAGRGYVAAFNA